MNASPDFRDNPLNWSLALGRIWGITIRVHIFFLLWIALEMIRRPSLSSLVITLLLFVVVLLHELGHCWGARHVGGDADRILLWPLGGLATVSAPMIPRAQFITAAAGPLVNVLFCIMSGLTLVLLTGNASEVPLNPFRLFGVSSVLIGDWGVVDWLIIVWSINYILLLFNLLPTFPMDGGRLLQAVIWKYAGYHQATLLATLVGMVGAIIFGLVGVTTNQHTLIAIAVFGYVTCWHQRQMVKSGMSEAEFWRPGHGDDGMFREQADSPKGLSGWLADRRATRQLRKNQQETEKRRSQEAQIDAILDKVHCQGIHSLTGREKRLLRSASAQQRQKD